MRISKSDVCVLTVPNLAFNEKVGLDNFLRLLLPLCHSITVITGEEFTQSYSNVTLIKLNVFSGASIVSKIFHKLVDQIREAIILIQQSKNYYIVFFHAGIIFNQLPLLTAKALRKRIVIYQFGGNYLLEQKLSAIKPWEKVVKPMSAAFSRLNYSVADVIILEGKKHLMYWDQLEGYRNKLACLLARDVNLERYCITKPLSDRENIVGYFGRLDPKKGILNFVRAIPIVLASNPKIKFVIAGTGPFKNKVEAELKTLEIVENVDLVGFISDEDIPKMLNDFKVLVLPTYDDGIPEVLKEAMACGTIVAVTPIGGVPDIVQDGEHGFFIQKNTPEGVADAILKALTSKDAQEISAKGRRLIGNVYGHEEMQSRYREMIFKAATNNSRCSHAISC